MAGTIIADTLTHSTAGSIATNYVVDGSAKAWFNYDQTAPSVEDSLNISSISDDSSGIFTNAFTNNMNNAAWAAGFITRNNRHQFNTNTSATSGRAWRTADAGNSVADTFHNCEICHGDLA